MSTSDLPPILSWENVAQPKGAVHIIHGLAEHPGRYERLARALNRASLVVWAHHQRGHGTNPVPGLLGHFGDDNGWRGLIDDAWVVSKQLQTKWPNLPLVSFSHSMGSFVGQALMTEHGASFKAAVFSGTNGPPGTREGAARVLAGPQRVILGKRKPGAWLQKLVIENTYNASFGPNAPPNTWLTRDPDEVKKYNEDEYCGFPLSCQAWLDLFNARAAQDSVAFFKKIPSALPIHVIAGTRDPVGEQAEGVRRLLKTFADAGLSRVSSCFYDDARHELVNETNRDEVTADLIAWIRGVIEGGSKKGGAEGGI